MAVDRLLCTGIAVLTLASGAAWAQTSSPGGSTSGSSMSSDSASSSMKMSKTDMKTMKSCQAMDHDAMMKAEKCKTLMAKHPDMFNSDGTMKSGATSPQ